MTNQAVLQILVGIALLVALYVGYHMYQDLQCDFYMEIAGETICLEAGK
jgi:hypothetical protein